MKLFVVLLVLAVAAVQANIQCRHKTLGQWIRTGNDIYTRNAQICRKKCRIWNAKHGGECVAFNWRPNNHRFPYKMRRRCILLKTARKVIEKEGWCTGTP